MNAYKQVRYLSYFLMITGVLIGIRGYFYYEYWMNFVWGVSPLEDPIQNMGLIMLIALGTFITGIVLHQSTYAVSVRDLAE